MKKLSFFVLLPLLVIVIAVAIGVGTKPSGPKDDAAAMERGKTILDPAAMERGKTIYDTTCVMCHQAGGVGIPPTFPPLAESDWLMADRVRAIRVLAEGLEGDIVVNGIRYEGRMPAQMLDDAQLADVMTYITNSWGNEAEPFGTEEVKAARLQSRFPTYEKLVAASSYQGLPEPPPGWKVEEVTRLTEFATRLAGPDADGNLYVLMQGGSLHRLTGNVLSPWLNSAAYLGPYSRFRAAAGVTIDAENRLWITTNNRITGSDGMFYNDVDIWRSKSPIGTGAPEMISWYNVQIPYGVGPFNHGVTNIAFGPDGKLYVSSGSRTDSGEAGGIPEIAKTGETDLTACIWRFDGNFTEEKSAGPPHVLARGLRNPHGFAWDEAGNLLAAVNGPDAHLAEELDIVEEGKHYGFPHQYADHSPTEHFYDHTPPAPAGLEFTPPMENIGPDGGQGFATFTPHSSPGGIMWCGEDYPEPLKNRFLVTRFGNLLNVPKDAGFDLLAVNPSKSADGRWQAEVHTVMERMARPLDVRARGDGSILILEYTRATDFKSGLGLLPGRVLVLSPL